jgi:hypothetical protein
MNQKPYQKPQLLIHGNIQTITQGEARRGLRDFFTFGDGDPVGRPKRFDPGS